MTTRNPRRSVGGQLLAIAILALTVYVTARVLLWLFPAELKMVWAWIQARV